MTSRENQELHVFKYKQQTIIESLRKLSQPFLFRANHLNEHRQPIDRLTPSPLDLLKFRTIFSVDDHSLTEIELLYYI